jgi:TRAP-type C4-dicarboxylate transport system permease small subunit
MSRLCNALSTLLARVAFVSLAIIVIALAGQVVFRYLLRAPLAHSDEIAQTALVWLTFTGAAFLYRERGHVEIDFLVDKLSPRSARGVSVLIELTILASMVMICVQVLQTRGVMERVIYGTLQLPKFWLHFVPLFVSALATIAFAIESVTKAAQRGNR